MRKVARRLSVSIVAVNFLVCMVTALVCMSGTEMYATLAAALACDGVIALAVRLQEDPNTFIPVFASSGLTALMLSAAPSGLLFIFVPVLGCMTGIVRPDPERLYARYTTAIAAAYFAVLWAARLHPPIAIESGIVAEITGTLGALASTALMVHVESYRKDMLKFEAKKNAESADKDALTGLNNRKSLDRFICEQAVKIESFSVIMMDIDNFKKVNDTYGHVEGDAVLKDLALVIQCHIRGDDRAFRYGGEEFAIVCPRTDQKGAGILAERIRTAFSQKIHHYENFTDPALRDRNFTISLGVADSRPGRFKDVKSLIACCDSALYEAKHNGKNQVRYYKDPDEDTLKLGTA